MDVLDWIRPMQRTQDVHNLHSIVRYSDLAKGAMNSDIPSGEIAGFRVGRATQQRVSVHPICRYVHPLAGAQRDSRIIRQTQSVSHDDFDLAVGDSCLVKFKLRFGQFRAIEHRRGLRALLAELSDDCGDGLRRKEAAIEALRRSTLRLARSFGSLTHPGWISLPIDVSLPSQ